MQEECSRGISRGARPAMAEPRRQAASHRGSFSFRRDQGPLNGFSTRLKSQVFWTIPEQLLDPVLPGQPPLSR